MQGAQQVGTSLMADIHRQVILWERKATRLRRRTGGEADVYRSCAAQLIGLVGPRVVFEKDHRPSNPSLDDINHRVIRWQGKAERMEELGFPKLANAYRTCATELAGVMERESP
jgi:hypothetical protein